MVETCVLMCIWDEYYFSCRGVRETTQWGYHLLMGRDITVRKIEERDNLGGQTAFVCLLVERDVHNVLLC